MNGQMNLLSIGQIAATIGCHVRNVPAFVAGTGNKRIFDDTNAGITSISWKYGVEFAAAVVKRVANRGWVFDLRDFWATIINSRHAALVNETIIGANSFRRKAA